MIHHKLVRDKIPEIIVSNGGKAEYRVLNAEEYRQALEKKLDEEVLEFHQDKTGEELADIIEVVFALAETVGCSRDELTKIYQKKHEARGGFEKGYFLISSE